MKKIWLLLFCSMLLLAQGRMLSPIPLPTWHIVDLDTENYDEYDLQRLLDEGQVFTFLAKSAHVSNPRLKTLRQTYMAMFNIAGGTAGATVRIAFIVPKIIGKYARTTTRSALGYLIDRGTPFEMDVYPLSDEGNATIDEALAQIGSRLYDLVVAPVTTKGAAYLCSRSLNHRLYIPTLHKSRSECGNDMVTFGGIDYEKQVETLSYLVESNATTVSVTDGSPLSQRLDAMVRMHLDVDDMLTLPRNGYYKNIIARHEDLNQSTLFLNTPILKSSLFLTQLTLADFKPALVLSTQLNYSPLLLTLTQYHDRENMVLASSIGKMDAFAGENIALLGEDVRFNWLNYATVVGIDTAYMQATGNRRLTEESTIDGAVDYSLRLYEAGLYRFIPRALPEPPENRIEENPMNDEGENGVDSNGLEEEPSVYDSEFQSEMIE
ncbi:hypothetical protein [Hydrogenimonas sp. SS33]|uniref:hypothetical protein n=1 Tax=Hydrogenimonas leucolamina TaxID=2954236 RepID=UPI00336C1451